MVSTVTKRRSQAELLAISSSIAELFVVRHYFLLAVAELLGGCRVAGSRTEMEAEGKEQRLRAGKLSDGERSQRTVCWLVSE